jgi:hypothetical protein
VVMDSQVGSMWLAAPRALYAAIAAGQVADALARGLGQVFRPLEHCPLKALR